MRNSLTSWHYPILIWLLNLARGKALPAHFEILVGGEDGFEGDHFFSVPGAGLDSRCLRHDGLGFFIAGGLSCLLLQSDLHLPLTVQ